MLRQQHIRALFSAIAAFTMISMVVLYVQMGEQTVKVKTPKVRHDEYREDPFEEADNGPRQVTVPHRKSGKHHMHEQNEAHYIIPGDGAVDADPRRGRIFAQVEKNVAIGLAITTKGQADIQPGRVPTELPFFRRLLLSFCHTLSHGFIYNFYLAHDHNDPFFHLNNSHSLFEEYFDDFIDRNCPHDANVSLHLVEVDHSGHPAWAQNDAMMAAYMDNMAYYYRVNDDTVLETTSWTENMIEELLRFNPPNVGVVGPWFRDGNIAILTHDFVHRTHIEIFGFYYPRVFTDWFADDWITGVYWPERSRKVAGVRVKHTMEMGSRYVAHYEKANRVAMEVDIGRTMIKRWVMGSGTVVWPKNSTFVISMALYGDNPHDMFGLLRYCQLLPIMLPGWRVRVYLEEPINGTTVHGTVPKLMRKKLKHMGIEAVIVDRDTAQVLPPTMWRLFIADDEKVERFLVRDPALRPSERETAAIQDWVKSGKLFHCIRDHPIHAEHPLTAEVVGGIPSALRKLTGKAWKSMMYGMTSDERFLNTLIWPLVNGSCLCHDSVSCKTYPSSKPYPVLRNDNEYVGQPYDENDQPLETDTRTWSEKFTSPDCVFLEDTGFKQSAVRAVIRIRPVLWSQDYHVTPVMDMKSLLGPVGVKVIDNSLSYYCGQVGTCAKSLRIITRENGMRLTPEIIEQFYDSYKDDFQMKQVSAFVCTLPVAMCEAFLPFNKSIIVISNIRYEQGRPEPEKWQTLNTNLRTIARHPRSILAANNLYDAKYMQYFLGEKYDPIVVPNYCAYLRDSYKPTKKQFLVTPIHNNDLADKFYVEFDEALIRHQADLIALPLRQMYPQYLFSDLASHPAIIYVPYQVHNCTDII